MDIKEIEALLEGVNIRSAKKKALLSVIQGDVKKKKKMLREVGDILDGFFSDTRNSMLTKTR